MADGSGGANTADSYIGSLISLTSKSEIRYEGILFTVDTENSNIALQNVRSFGTEGRKKDGLPIYASDKVYDYIIFRGSDIKDLQVKSSPSIQPPPQPPTDPAIISLQSQYSQPASIPPSPYAQAQPGPQDAPPQLPYPGLPPSAFRGGVPQMYQTAAAWGPPPPTGPNGNLAMPMYWPGYYRPPGGQPFLQQQMPPQPPPSLPQPPLPQPQTQPQPDAFRRQSSQQLGSRPTPPLNLSSGIPPPPLASQLQPVSGPLPSTSSVPAVSETAPAVPTAPIAPVAGSNALQAPVVSTPLSPPSSVASSLPVSAAVSAPPAMQGVSAVITPAAKNPRRVVGSAQPSLPQAQSSGASLGTNSSGLITPAVSSASTGVAQRSIAATQAPPGVLSASGKSVVSSQIKQGVEPESAQHQPAVSTPGQTPQQQTQPLLPLPTASTPQKQTHQGNGTMGHTYVRRGRGRGSGSGRGIGVAHPTQQFTEDFDFTAMNEKFNKDEVWGELGGKGESREKVVDDVEEELVDGILDDEDLDKGALDPSKKPVYVKDDFFDSLSCDALDREEGRAERTKFSEQRKIDTETFGNFPLRSRGGRRGGRRGGYRGGYYGGGYMGGRGNGYGRGRGAPRSATAIN
ncbi:unnamed protein product [Calypogeia fissa]